VSLPWALPLVIVMQTRSAGVSPRPVAWAVQSPRPAACLGVPGLWEVSRQAATLRRCRELSRAQALLQRSPEQALARSAALLAEAPDSVEARVLHGRASLRLGDAATALRELSPLLTVDAAAPADPSALLDGGRAALGVRDLASALGFYRLLGNRAALLPDQSQQVVAYLEIAAVLLATDDASGDAQAFLREARRRSAGSGLSGLCSALSALGWLVQGREAEAQGALRDVTDVAALARFEQRKLVWLPDGLLHAVQAVALEREQPDAAAAHYQALAAGPLAKTKLGQLASRAKGHAQNGKAGSRGSK